VLKIQGEKIYLAALERADCKKLYEDFEYDFANPTDTVLLGCSNESADAWYDDIQRLIRENVNIRVGIFLPDGTVIGDVALQDINDKNRSCSIGIGIAKFEHRGKGYGAETMRLLLGYAFDNLGMERVSAETLEINIASQKALEKCGFTLEGRARQAVYFRGKRYDELHYAILASEWRTQ